MSYFDRFDICNAYMMYALLWGSDRDHYTNHISVRLSAIKYRPAHSEECLEGMSENAKEIYGRLERKHHANHVAYERLHRRAPSVFPAWPGSNNLRVRAIDDPYRMYVRSLGVDARALDCWIE